MKKSLILAILTATAPLALAFQQPEPPIDLDKLRAKPIANGGGKVGELLRQWWKEGTAAGNAGDCYDNRDGDHSPLNLTPYPQLTPIKYSAADIKLGKHWAAQRVILPHVTFGNSSTSAPAHLGGSNPRSYYVSSFGLNLLHDQYTKNNLYIYPEHRDHDPGHNGSFFLPSGLREEGYGDMYPTNTPYLIISQGSSGSDQPFMRMMPSVLAAFRPEVKKKLAETGTLMPTIQMLFRSTNKHLKDPKEYLTGKAHPTVFEGSWVDELAMLQKAHALELKSLPPIVKLHVVEEDKAIQGVDYFDPAHIEGLSYTAGCIARVHRSKAHTHRLVVSAAGSFDHNKSKLTHTWVILRGDPDKIKIVPKKDDQSVAEITVAWHERRPVSPGSPLESNRVDIGVFVHNGAYYSAPAFVTICTLDREARTYSDAGKLLDIAHGLGETDVRVTNWEQLAGRFASDVATAELFSLTKEQKRYFQEVQDALLRCNQRLEHAQANVKKVEEALKNSKAGADVAEAMKKLDEARMRVSTVQKRTAELLDEKADLLGISLGASPRQFVESRFAKLTRDPLFTQKHADWIKVQRAAKSNPRVNSAYQKLVRLGIIGSNDHLTPLLPGKTLADARWTQFELAQLEWLHATLLAEFAFPGTLQVEYRTNYVDHRRSVPREWRDVQRYDAKGGWLGWTRHSSEGVLLFNHEGLLVVEKDAQLRCIKGREVRYVQDPPKAKTINTNPLRMVPGNTVVVYEFTGKDDMRGRRLGTEAVKDQKK